MGLIKRLFRKKKKEEPKILTNVLNASHKKVALLAYIKWVFQADRSQINTTHTNIYTTLLIADTLNELGYNVDVIDWQDCFEGDASGYDLVIGLGKSLEDILGFRLKGSKPKVVWFGTGCNPHFGNIASMSRGVSFYHKKGRFLMESLRYTAEDWPLQHEIPDWIILHGDKFSKNTYRKNAISSILAPVFIFHDIKRSDEEWIKAKTGFIWFGSRGGIHKGLDLCIDTFKDLPQFNLHVCGNFDYEPNFIELYKDIIEKSPNIHLHGYVDIQSATFSDVLQQCAFIIFPSASEANSPSVITCMANGGLIPVVTPNADVNIENYGIEIKGFEEHHIIDAINESQKLSIEQLQEQSIKILSTTKTYHTFDHFKADFKNKLQEALNNIA